MTIRRSKIRIFLGTIYFSLKKHFYWNFSRAKFGQITDQKLPIEIFSKKTPMRRKLKDVDMWMQENKINNLRIAIGKLNGLVLKPGEVFSYWRQIGKPTRRKGYLEGMVLHNGQVISGIGGGLCQLSNLIYWITLHTPLTVIERWRHSYDVFPDVRRDQPFGSGATCSYPNIDLQIRNNTNQKFQLSLELNEKYLIGKWLSNKPIDFSYEIFEKKHTIKQEWWGGYVRSNEIFRKIFDKNKKEIKEELITKNEAIMMYNPL